ncbi:substrate-binding domain-containing protein [Pseudomonas sp. NPDC077649]|uniref:LacI family DNA-binding transcriptional regulator n=1 Tax=Pseudomonas sp. NPDC077649 TaxID=3364423 RepID=UPI0037C50A1D
MTQNQKPKLRDVARLAGVSVGSASRALSAPNAVKPLTLAKVEAAVRELGYVRDGAARALALRRTYSIGAVFPTLNNPIFADVVQFLHQRLYERKYQLIVASHEYNRAREVESINNLIDRGVEGILLVGTDHDPAVFESLRIAKRPFILMWSLDECRDHYCVGFSNEKCGTLIARHLLELGHTRIAVLGSDHQYNERIRFRLKGIRDTMREKGLDLPDSHVILQPFSIEGGRAGLRLAMELEPRPTALICSTDIQSIGANAEAQSMNIRVPTDLSITGFDDISFSAVSSPPLTTVRIGIADIGRISADNIVSLIEGKAVARQERIQVDLVVRESTAPPLRKS